MSNTPPAGGARVQQPQARQVAFPGASQPQKRQSVLLVIGVVLVAGAGFAFWFVLQSVDQRSDYLVAARNISRWDTVTAQDFLPVSAHVGMASALTVDQIDSVVGKWATGRIPAGTLITEGLFETPPLSGEEESDKVLISVNLPTGEAPFGTLETGERVALLGIEPLDPAEAALATLTEDAPVEEDTLSLIGVLTLDLVIDENILYLVTPQEAWTIQDTIQRFTASRDRRIWKVGHELTTAQIVAALREAQEGSGTVSGTLGGSERSLTGSTPTQEQ